MNAFIKNSLVTLAVTGDGGAFTYFAAATVLAGVAVAFVDLNLAVFAGEAGPAGAGVAALTGVGARGSVLAGLVVGAVVQVWREETQE